MKVTVIGNGSIGQRHLKGLTILSKELNIDEVRSFDTNPERRTQVKENIPTAKIFESIEEAVTGTDLVFMCAPTSLHIPIYENISKYGDFHLFFEKPLSHTIEGCEQMLFDQKRKGKKIAVGYMLHHHPVLLEAKEIIESGMLGRILSVRAECGLYLPFWHPWEDYRDFYMSWKTGGGGALLDSSHEINYLQWIFGDITEVQGFMGTISDLEISSDDLALMIVKFKSGVIGQIQLDLFQMEESRYCKVIGTNGVMIADLIKKTIRYNTKENTEWSEKKIDVDFDKIYHTEYMNAFKFFAGEDGYVVSGEDAYATMEVIEAVRRSHAYSTVVKVPLYN
jgi:predicted dehydrogenase